jgi:hypothetical protein
MKWMNVLLSSKGKGVLGVEDARGFEVPLSTD